MSDAGVQPVYSLRVDTEDHAFITNGFISHNTECRLDPMAMEMLRDIDEDTVDFVPNYDGRTQEPTVLPARIPNLLVNGSEGIAVGMATKIPPHNLREIGDGRAVVPGQPRRGRGDDPRRADQDRQGAGLPDRRPDRGHGADRGGVPHRPRLDPDARGRRRRGGHARAAPRLVVTELPYQVNPDNLAERIAELVREGKLAGIADIRDESSGRTGMRLVLVLKRDAVAKVVLNNLYKHTQLQETFGANMLALVDGVPRTLNLAQFVRLLRRAPDRGHPPADRVPAAQGRGAGAHPARLRQGAG